MQPRRGVALFGPLDAFILPLQLEAQQQAFESALQASWLGDSGREWWRRYKPYFAHCAIAELDCFHTAEQRWRSDAIPQGA